ncbi:MAG: 23S rRNA (adenine(2503)-C(2))-methyltransferase RlmN [Actinomycetia bacterium]|nr:23S rRNA (adenine(2503)-C(2))-methyltransferase RlmN [Actinomycetes bacterium]
MTTSGPALDITAKGAKPARPANHWADLALPERRDAVAALGLPQFRADQISRQYYGRLSAAPQEWSEFNATTSATVQKAWFPELLEPVSALSCDAGETVKRLHRLTGGALVESVIMAYPDRVTACVSSQAGCGMACPFCATGQGGLTRNLTTGEIVEQVRQAAVLAQQNHLGKGRLSNIVFMGMGEPLANYKPLLAALHRIVDPSPAGFGISARSVTVSTVGLVPRIGQLAQEGLPVTLAVSLHAPDDELRDTLVPINTRWQVAEVLDAADNYADKTGRRYSIEYALIRDINDQPWRADLLGQLLRDRLTHVNLIPLNPTPGSIWTASTGAAQDAFVAGLQRHGVHVTVRDTRGQEIDGACGQLAASRRED